MAVAFFDRDAGLRQFSDEQVADPDVLALAAKIRYVIDPDNEYARNYSGHVCVTKTDGSVVEFRQPHFPGGVREPLSRDELIRKFEGNVAYGGATAAYGHSLLEFCVGLVEREQMSAITDNGP